MSSRMLGRAIDFFVRPQIERFVMKHCLRMSQSELLRGGRLAATATHEALHAALVHGDAEAAGDVEAALQPLRQMVADDCLSHELYRELSREVQRGREAQHEQGGAVLALMQAVLAEQRALVAEGEAALTAMRLVVGMRRELAAESGLAGFHRLHVGSHLVILDEQPHGLWKVARQRELLLQRGCCVQLEVSFGQTAPGAPAGAALQQARATVREARATAASASVGGASLSAAPGLEEEAPPQRFLLEASLDGSSLSAAAEDEEEYRRDDLAVKVADLNGITGGNFWAAASEATPWRDAMRGGL